MLDVIAGSFTIHFIPYFALIDIRSTNSYVSCNMFEKFSVGVEETTTNVTIVSLF